MWDLVFSTFHVVHVPKIHTRIPLNTKYVNDNGAD